jgi:hypothetical protein
MINPKKMESTMGAPKVNLLDPSQEPTNEQLAGVMKGFADDVRQKKSKARETVDGHLEDAFREDTAAAGPSPR